MDIFLVKNDRKNGVNLYSSERPTIVIPQRCEWSSEGEDGNSPEGKRGKTKFLSTKNTDLA
uniref:Uncharacterized protein n=1 Tax=Romanomermis culicivorax TaxID=13658 RepID=A0A915L8N3_ROMCU